MINDSETPAEFLATLGKNLKMSENVDTELAELLVEHILVKSPDEECLDNAMEAIRTLAETRVASLEENTDG